MAKPAQRNLVAILHAAVPPDAAADEQDTLVQIGVVAAALKRLGWTPVQVPVTLDLAAMAARLKKMNPAVVFNLVESLGGRGQHQHLPASVLDAMGLPYTGNGTVALFETTNKALTKCRLADAGIATAPWFEASEAPPKIAGKLIVKPVWEDASIGIDAGAVVGGVAEARRRMAEMAARHGGEWFAESFVDGREFNIAMLESPELPPDRPLLLPASELRFIDFPPGMPRVADYASKWDKGSFAYIHTPLCLDIEDELAPLIERLGEIALECWKLFGLRGYARVDFRLDRKNEPFVLEVNANPCLSPDSGFAAMLRKAGMSFDQGIDMIVESRLRREAAVQRAS